jgi:dihydroorotate dehydrogenase
LKKKKNHSLRIHSFLPASKQARRRRRRQRRRRRNSARARAATRAKIVDRNDMSSRTVGKSFLRFRRVLAERVERKDFFFTPGVNVNGKGETMMFHRRHQRRSFAGGGKGGKKMNKHGKSLKKRSTTNNPSSSSESSSSSKTTPAAPARSTTSPPQNVSSSSSPKTPTMSSASASASASKSPTPAPTNQSSSSSSSSSLLKTIGALSLFASIGYGSLRAADSPLASDVEFKTFEFLAPVFSRLMDAESAHNLGVSLFANGLYPIERRERDNDRNNADASGEYAEMREMLRVTNVFNDGLMTFPNPIGLAAGFDKDAKTIQGMREIGFGFVEIGSVTPQPQDGNPKPRVFRLRELDAVINRYGFNSEGIERAKERLKKEKNRVAATVVDNKTEEKEESTTTTTTNVIAPIGVNLGKNKTTPESEAAKSYALGATELGPFADYLVINVSSPNTPGLRDLQKGSSLVKILRDVVNARDRLLVKEEKKKSLPVLVKIAPDVDEKGLKEIAKAVKKAKIDGVIISNTTIERNDRVQQHENGKEIGGLSGKPVFEKSTEVLRRFYELTDGSIPLVGCGGVFTGEDALKKIKAGASLVQLYTSFAYAGPALIPKVKRELYEALKREGFKNVNEAVGYDVKQRKKRNRFLFF